MSNLKQPFFSASLAGETKELLRQAFEFLLDHAGTDINSFLIDKNGPLVFCKVYPNQKNIDPIYYPFKPNAVVLTEHVFQYLSELTPAQKECMGCVKQGIDDLEVEGWELFIPDDISVNNGIASYRDGTTILAVRPIIIGYGK